MLYDATDIGISYPGAARLVCEPTAERVTHRASAFRGPSALSFAASAAGASAIRAATVLTNSWICHRSDRFKLLVEYEAPIAKGALMGATGRIWTEDGRLIASGGSQMLCITPGAGVPAPRQSEPASKHAPADV